MPLLDLKISKVINFITEERGEITSEYGRISTSQGILRKIIELEQQEPNYFLERNVL
jgi:hypothetical protein